MNAGQWDQRVLFKAAASWGTLWITREGVFYEFVQKSAHRSLLDRFRNPTKSDPLFNRVQRGSAPISTVESACFGQRESIKMDYAGGHATGIVGLEKRAYTQNYLLGSNPSRWRTDVPSFGAVLLRDSVAGLDVRFTAVNDRIACDLILARGTDLRNTELRIEATDSTSVTLNSAGRLVMKTIWGDLVDLTPRVFQDGSADRSELPCALEQLKPGRYGFNRSAEVRSPEARPAADFDDYSTYLGGSRSEYGQAIAVDHEGAVYITGQTNSKDYPTVGAIQDSLTVGGHYGNDIFVTKLTPDGASIAYSTYLGGPDDDQGLAIAVDAQGAVYVAGQACSGDFPLGNPGYSGCHLIVVAKLTPSGDAIAFSKFLGAGEANGIAVDNSGSAYVTGVITGALPTTNALQGEFQGGLFDAFVAQLTPSGNDLVYCTYLGGNDVDAGLDITVANGSTWITGFTCSVDFPLRNPYAQVYQGGFWPGDVFITRISKAGNEFEYSTFLGGSGSETGLGIAVDTKGAAYVTGWTESWDFPTVNPVQRRHSEASYDGFVTKILPDGNKPVYSTYLGGNGYDIGEAIRVDTLGQAWVSGVMGSSDFPTVNSIQSVNAGAWDAFATKFSTTGDHLLFSTYFGGSDYDVAYGMDIGGPDTVYLTGYAVSTDFPTKDPLQPALNGSPDIFVARLVPPNKGDVDDNGMIQSSDIVYLVNYLFRLGPSPKPTQASGDVNCTQTVSTSDVIYLVNFVFRGGAAPC